MMAAIYELDDSTQIRLVLYKNVKNSADLIQKLKSGVFNCSFINPKLIVDGFQVATAAFKAVSSQKSNKLITRTVFTEILFNLSNRRSITRALATFGLQTDSDSLLVVLMNDKTDEEFEKVSKHVEGTKVDLEELEELTDLRAVNKEYEISPTEVQVGSVLDVILGRMAIKDCQ